MQRSSIAHVSANYTDADSSTITLNNVDHLIEIAILKLYRLFQLTVHYKIPSKKYLKFYIFSNFNRIFYDCNILRQN